MLIRLNRVTIILTFAAWRWCQSWLYQSSGQTALPLTWSCAEVAAHVKLIVSHGLFCVCAIAVRFLLTLPMRRLDQALLIIIVMNYYIIIWQGCWLVTHNSDWSFDASLLTWLVTRGLTRDSALWFRPVMVESLLSHTHTEDRQSAIHSPASVLIFNKNVWNM